MHLGYILACGIFVGETEYAQKIANKANILLHISLHSGMLFATACMEVSTAAIKVCCTQDNQNNVQIVLFSRPWACAMV